MASIQADMPFHLIGGSLDDKQNFKTLEEMKNCPEDSLGKTAMCTNDADGKIYVFNINNEVSEETGKWKVVEGGEIPIITKDKTTGYIKASGEADVMFDSVYKYNILTTDKYRKVVGLMVRKEDNKIVYTTFDNQCCLVIDLKADTNYKIYKDMYTNRFRVFLTKQEIPTETTNVNNPTIYAEGEKIFDDTTVNNYDFYNKDYKYAVIYFCNMSTDYNNVKFTIYESTKEDAYDFALVKGINKEEIENNTQFKIVDNIRNNVSKNINTDTSFYELGGISYTNGTLTNDNTYTLRTTDFVSKDVKMLKVIDKTKYTVGLRIYDINGKYSSSKSITEFDFNHNINKYKFIIIKNDKTDISVDEGLTAVELYYDGLDVVTRRLPIDNTWDKWEDVRYNYGFNTDLQPKFNTISGVLESDTMLSVRGGKGRWNKTDKPSSSFVSGGHVFEGWSGKELCRLTMLIGKFHETFACIQTYSPAGLYETNRRFGWVKLGSDELNKGADFSQNWSTLYTPLTLHSLSSAPTKVSDSDLNPQMSSYTNSVPNGTIYFNSNSDINKIKCKTDDGWKTLIFEEDLTKYDDTGWVSTGLGMVVDNEKITINGISLKRIGDAVAFRIHGFMKTECSNTTVTDIITNIPDKYRPNSSASIPVLGHGTGDNVGIYVDEITFTSNGTLNLSLQGTPKDEYFSWEGHYHINI